MTCGGSPSPICWPTRVPVAVWLRLRNIRPQASVPAGLCAVHRGVTAVRLGDGPAVTHRLSHPAMQRRQPARRQQHRDPDQVDALGQRGRAMGFLTASQAVGLSAGPVVGGILLDTLGWQWVFWAAVPFGLAALMLGWLVLPQSTDLTGSTDLDWHGALLLMPALVLGVLVLNQTSVWPLLSPAMILSVLAAIVLLALFLRHERVAASPLVDLSLFGANAFTAGIAGVAMGYALMYGMFFLMSFALIHGLHESARLVGIKLAV